jgi:hypothetical protein
MLTRKSVGRNQSAFDPGVEFKVQFPDCFRTLYRRLSSSSSKQAHRSDHKVLEHSIGYLRVAGFVVPKAGNLVDVDCSPRVFERSVEAGGRSGRYGTGLMPSLGCIGSYEGVRRGGGEAGGFCGGRKGVSSPAPQSRACGGRRWTHRRGRRAEKECCHED